MHQARIAIVLAALTLLAVPANAAWLVDEIDMDSTATSPILVNPVTNKLFALHWLGEGVSIIDGVTHEKLTVYPLGSFLSSPATNPLANRYYFIRALPAPFSHIVALDCSALDTSIISLTGSPSSPCINALRGKLYTDTPDSGLLYEIDETTFDTLSFIVDSSARAPALNTATGVVYVANWSLGRLIAVDPVTGDTAQVSVGDEPNSAIVNPATNKVYVGHPDLAVVTVVDGTTLDTAQVPARSTPGRAVVHPATNKVYFPNLGTEYITVIDGATNDTTLLAMPGQVQNLGVEVDPVTNRVYVLNRSPDMAIIDGYTDSVSLVPMDSLTSALVINPVTNRIYICGSVSPFLQVWENADYSIDTVPGWLSLYDVAVDPVRNRAWVTNWELGAVTMLDVTADDTSMVAVNPNPEVVVVDPVANRVFSLHATGAKATVIDGTSLDTSSVQLQFGGTQGAVNVATGRVFITHESNDYVTVLDGATLEQTLVPAGNGPRAVAINPHTNRAYVANLWGNTVTVIDGSTLDTTVVPVGAVPFGIAVNPVTNRIYVTNYNDNNVTEINGEDNSTRTIAAGTGPSYVAVNQMTDMVFVANYTDGTVTVFGGPSSETRTVTVGRQPMEIVVDPVADKAYVACWGSGEVWVIDGSTCASTSFASGSGTGQLAVNPVTGQLFVLGSAYNIRVVTPAPVADTKVHTYLDAALPCTTGFARPQLHGTAVNRWSPYRTSILAVLNRVGTARRDWNTALPVGGPADSVDWYWQWGDDSLVMGENFICCVPVEPNVATTHILGYTPFVGNMKVYPIYRTSLSAGVGGSAPVTAQTQPGPTIVRGVLVLGDRGQKTEDRAALLDISGRKVLNLQPGANDVRELAPGVYFVRSAGGARPAVSRVIVSK